MKIKAYFNTLLFVDVSTTIQSRYNSYEPRKEILEYIGEFEAEDLEDAYARLQHTDTSSVIPEQRSASVGDVLETSEGFFLIQAFGFKKLDYLSIESCRKDPDF